MKRLLWLVATLVALGAFPATAGAKDVYGVAIAKNGHRKTIVAATANGAVQTIRVRRLGKLKLGNRFDATGRMLADGTMSASRVRPLGRADQVRFRATVVRLDRKQGRLILSAGKSVFGVKLRSPRRTTASSEEGLQPGDKVECEARVGNDGLAAEEKHVTEIGHTDKLELEGIYLFANEGGISIAVLHRGLVHVQVPKGFDLPDIAAGDEVALLVSVEANGSFTLIRLKDEDTPPEEGGGKEPTPPPDLYVSGAISQIRVDGLAVKPDDKPAANCALPAGLSLANFAVGDRVGMKCRLDGGRYLLVALKSDHAYIGPDTTSGIALTGVIAEIGDTFVRVQPDGDGPSVRCDAPAGVTFAGFAVGDSVAMKCRLDGAHYILVAIKSWSTSIPAPPPSADVTVAGAVTEKGSTFVRVQPDGGAPSVRCDFAEGVNLEAFPVGAHVGMLCRLVDGHYKLAALKSETAVLIL